MKLMRPRMIFCLTVFTLFFCVAGISLSGGEIPVLLSLKPPSGMIRADLYHVKMAKVPKAVLVLAPGYNGNGRRLVCDPVWQAFAKKRNLDLIGLSFASEVEDLRNGKGYYYAHNGSGKTLLKGIHKLFDKSMPVLLYGFSGGAHFASRFVEWKPEIVITWCAYSAGWWEKPESSEIMPPGIIACGKDDSRLNASLSYFKQGRALGRPWLWIGIPKSGHFPDKRVEVFIRDYFSIILKEKEFINPSKNGQWITMDNGDRLKERFIGKNDSNTAWLPSRKLLGKWRKLNGF